MDHPVITSRSIKDNLRYPNQYERFSIINNSINERNYYEWNLEINIQIRYVEELPITLKFKLVKSIHPNSIWLIMFYKLPKATELINKIEQNSISVICQGKTFISFRVFLQIDMYNYNLCYQIQRISNSYIKPKYDLKFSFKRIICLSFCFYTTKSNTNTKFEEQRETSVPDRQSLSDAGGIDVTPLGIQTAIAGHGKEITIFSTIFRWSSTPWNPFTKTRLTFTVTLGSIIACPMYACASWKNQITLESF